MRFLSNIWTKCCDCMFTFRYYMCWWHPDNFILLGRTLRTNRKNIGQLSKNNIILKLDKPKLTAGEVQFWGFILSSSGMTPCSEIMNAIQQFAQPGVLDNTYKLTYNGLTWVSCVPRNTHFPSTVYYFQFTNSHIMSTYFQAHLPQPLSILNFPNWDLATVF